MRFLSCHYCVTTPKANHRFIFLEVNPESKKLANAIREKEKTLNKDVTKEEDVEKKATDIDEKINKSQLTPEYKEKAKKELKKLLEDHEKGLSTIKETSESSLKTATDTIQHDLDKFESRDEVRAIFDIINTPEFANIEQRGKEIQASIQKSEVAMDEYLKHIQASGESKKGHEADIEKYSMARLSFLESLRGYVDISQRFIAKDPAQVEQRKSLLKSMLGNDAKLRIPILQADRGIHAGIKKITGEMEIPDSTKEVEELQAIGKQELLHLRATLYRMTGDKVYEPYYQEFNEQADTTLLNDALDHIQHTENITPNDKPLQDIALGKIGELSATFSEIQAMSAKDPAGAQQKAKDFLDRIDALQHGAYTVDSDPGVLLAVKKHPELQETFRTALKKYTDATEDLLIETLQNHPVMRDYRDQKTDVIGRTNLYIQSVKTMFEQVQKTGEEPSKTTMAMFHTEAQKILNDPAFNKLLSSPADQLISTLAAPFEHTAPHLSAKIAEFKKMSAQTTEYLRSVNTITRQVIGMKGHGVGAVDFFKDAAKYTAITAAAVAGAAAMGALVAATGGLAAAPVASFVMGTVATSLGAAIGSQYATAAIEGNTDAISTQNMAMAWAQGAAFAGGGQLTGQALGTLGGKLAASLTSKFPTLSVKAQSYVAAEFERLAQKAAADSAFAENPQTLAASLKHIATKIFEETGEEITEDAMQKIGEGLAPSHPELGFLFSMIPSATKTGRYTFQTEVHRNMISNSAAPIAPTNITTETEAHNSTVPQDDIQQYLPHEQEHIDAQAKIFHDYVDISRRSGKGADIDSLRNDVALGKITMEQFKIKTAEIYEQTGRAISDLRDLISMNKGDLTLETIDNVLTNAYPNMPIEQKDMLFLTAANMLRRFAETRKLDKDLALKAGSPDATHSQKAEQLKNKIINLINKKYLTPFEGNIDYAIIDGVLCIRPENPNDYIELTGGQSTDTSQGTLFKSDDTNMGVVILVQSNIELSSESDVIQHELQHVYKSASNYEENGALNTFNRKKREGKWNLLTNNNEPDRDAMHEYFHVIGKENMVRLKDEALAFLTTHSCPMSDIYPILTNQGGSYDYFQRNELFYYVNMGMVDATEKTNDPTALTTMFYEEIGAARKVYISRAKSIIGSLLEDIRYLVENHGMNEHDTREQIRDYLMFVPADMWAFAMDNLRLKADVEASNKAFNIDDARRQAKEGEITWETFDKQVHEIQHKVGEITQSLRNEIQNNPNFAIADIHGKFLKDSDIPINQQQMIFATASSMILIRDRTNTIMQGMSTETLKQRIVEAGNLKDFDGEIEYKIIDGVLCIQCKSDIDFAKFIGRHESHTSLAVALKANETGLGMGMIVVSSHVELDAKSSVIQHEMQHIIKQGTNHLETEPYRDELSVKNYFNIIKAEAEKNLKDEALAFLMTYHMGMENVRETLIRDGGSYDYIGQHRQIDFYQDLEKQFGGELSKEQSQEFFTQWEQASREYKQKAKEYTQDLVDTADQLGTQMHSSIDARQYLCNYLMFVPIDQWPFQLNVLRNTMRAKAETQLQGTAEIQQKLFTDPAFIDPGHKNHTEAQQSQKIESTTAIIRKQSDRIESRKIQDTFEWTEQDWTDEQKNLEHLPGIGDRSGDYFTNRLNVSLEKATQDHHAKTIDIQDKSELIDPKLIIMSEGGAHWGMSYHKTRASRYTPGHIDPEPAVTEIAKKIVGKAKNLNNDFSDVELMDELKDVYGDEYIGQRVGVHRIDGPRGPFYIVQDGFHRTSAAKLVGLKKIRVFAVGMEKGQNAEAVWYETLALMPDSARVALMEAYDSIYPPSADEVKNETTKFKQAMQQYYTEHHAEQEKWKKIKAENDRQIALSSKTKRDR